MSSVWKLAPALNARTFCHVHSIGPSHTRRHPVPKCRLFLDSWAPAAQTHAARPSNLRHPQSSARMFVVEQNDWIRRITEGDRDTLNHNNALSPRGGVSRPTLWHVCVAFAVDHSHGDSISWFCTFSFNIWIYWGGTRTAWDFMIEFNACTLI